jgi:hypothetical protein
MQDNESQIKLCCSTIETLDSYIREGMKPSRDIRTFRQVASKVNTEIKKLNFQREAHFECQEKIKILKTCID